jgi:omega-amidase
VSEASLDVITVALVQAELHWQDPAANRDHLAGLMDRQPGCDLYVLPETFSTGFLGDRTDRPETMDGETVAWMQKQARVRSAVVAGSLAMLDAQHRRLNRFLFVTADGVLAHYDKRHLFGFGGEDERYRRGQSPTVVEWRGWRVDLQICYDLRFPVWCRNNRGFDLQIFVANWPAPRVEAWSALLKARAIENQSYVIGVNRTGSDGNGINYSGRTAAFSPMGELVTAMGDEEDVKVINLNINMLQDFRENFPFLSDADEFTLSLNPEP